VVPRPPPRELGGRHKTLLKLNYVLSTFAAFLNVDTLTLRALILTVVWQCSYMDVWGYYEHDQMVRWFLGRPLSKSELHRRAKRLGLNPFSR